MTNHKVTVGHAIAALLERCGVRLAFGVISIHNMPILDAIHARGRVRFVPARGEAGATNMADSCARSSGTLGVAITSTGTAAGNAAGAMVEALTAGTPLLHITGQIETPYLDRDLAYIHEAPDQLAMLRAVSKEAFRVRSAETAVATFRQAIQAALSAPSGPVSVEVPIDIQGALIELPDELDPLPVIAGVAEPRSIERLAAALRQARRPLLWLGGGARAAAPQVARLVAMGFGVVTSTQGRGIVPEDHPRSLGAYTQHKAVEELYASCDAMLAVGTRLRSNETLKYQLRLPDNLYRIDADPSADGRCYPSRQFICADAATALQALADQLESGMRIDPRFDADLAATRQRAAEQLRNGLGPYAALVDALQGAAGRNFNWVRDVTISNSTWGNRELRLFSPDAGVHALGGGIGQGLAMAIGASIGAAAYDTGRKTWCLAGDGGFILNIGELATAVQERANLAILLMNDKGYGVIKNIQDAVYGGRRCYVDLHTPDYAQVARSFGLRHHRVDRLDDIAAVLESCRDCAEPVLIEVDMLAIGPFRDAFAGPPVKAAQAAPVAAH